jgi:hypothetical protein
LRVELFVPWPRFDPDAETAEATTATRERA